ncbi:fibronectin type III domain-containing protein [Enterococcus pseudoavium]|uniref:Fibronectin type III domain-containing protein n=1 Tax=Enterococcus pseudoavium TaxID=44007 RepID=A0AAE4I4M0_9ENTE|nr:fibronectin type III domain-containing protein [Enterococcus pseudoavium]MDT2738057.1 fibronectin type III domain-containing protein [Enterococcus pseudoavium]
MNVTAGNGKVSYALTDPAGASGITGYKILYRTGSAAFAEKEVTAKTGEITGLTNGSQYDFKAQAKNEVSYGKESTIVKATPTA